MDEHDIARFRVVVGTVLLLIVVGGTTDLVLDEPDRWLSLHVILEVAIVSVSLGFAVYLWRGWWRAERSLGEMRERLASKQAERDVWRESARAALEGLGQAIDRQFATWDLTPAEREVALLVLKGYSHKHIARLTDRSDRTVRQHAGSVYRKAGLSGRAELAAFFLEDLILPETRRDVHA